MIYNYNPLWKQLIDRGITKTQLKDRAHVSTNIIAKMGKDEPVSMESLAKICTTLECGLDDIVEIITEKADIDIKEKARFIDLFAGIGGIRKGFELACEERGIATQCVFTSEIKPYAIDILKQNHPGEEIHGDITAISADDIPDFDFLLAGFPCQAFSAAGKRLGFEDPAEPCSLMLHVYLKQNSPMVLCLKM